MSTPSGLLVPRLLILLAGPLVAAVVIFTSLPAEAALAAIPIAVIGVLWEDFATRRGYVPAPKVARPWFAVRLALKRVIDIVLGGLLVVVLAPIFAVVALLVRVSGPGAVIVPEPLRTRSGKLLVKRRFRTSGDPRRRFGDIGKALDRSGLANLPELAQVVRGDLSLVGPRALTEAEWREAGRPDSNAFWSGAVRFRPGIVGLWSFVDKDYLRYDELLAYDEKYVREWSLHCDLVLLAKMAFYAVRGYPRVPIRPARMHAVTATSTSAARVARRGGSGFKISR